MTAAIERYSGPLGQLLYSLRDPLAAAPLGTWLRRVLSRGAMISVARSGDGRRILLISRPTPPRDERGAKAWAREVDTFLHWFSATRWEPIDALPPQAFDGLEAAVWNAFIEPEEEDAGRGGST